jgi:hypothetical protein
MSPLPAPLSISDAFDLLLTDCPWVMPQCGTAFGSVVLPQVAFLNGLGLHLHSSEPPHGARRPATRRRVRSDGPSRWNPNFAILKRFAA